MKAIWLCSWYPNPFNPYDGDFVQRHAFATAKFLPVTLFFVGQYGEASDTNEDKLVEAGRDGLKEKIIFFKFKKTGINFLDKLIYNARYLSVYKKALKEHISKEGLPAIVHVHVPMKAGMLAIWLKRKYGIPFIVTEHSSAYNSVAEDSFFKRKKIYQLNIKRILNNAAITTVVSASVGKILKELFRLKRVETIHNVADISLFNYKPQHAGKFRFIHASTMTQQKNIEGMLRAFAKLKDLRTDWECEMLGWDTPVLKKLSADLGLNEFVKWQGPLGYAEVARHMQKSSALVLFSRHENFPCVIVEALCCGLPVIATNVGGVAEAIDSSNGILVESEKEDQLLKAMSDMIDKSKNFDREAISIAAQSKFSYEVIGKQFYHLYQELNNNN
jgi:glycosyltransferase involved in cell wall biosynthesis